MQVLLFHACAVEVERRKYVGAYSLASSHGSPRAFPAYFLLRTAWLEWREHQLFHHLPDDTVTQYHGRVTVFEREFEGQVHEVGHFLYRSRSQHNHIVVAVSASACRLEVIGLAGLYGTQSGASPLHVDNQSRYFRSGHVCDAFLHQGHAGA